MCRVWASPRLSGGALDSCWGREVLAPNSDSTGLSCTLLPDSWAGRKIAMEFRSFVSFLSSWARCWRH